MKVPTLFARIRVWGESKAMQRSMQEMGGKRG
jgi:hypothetical protein